MLLSYQPARVLYVNKDTHTEGKRRTVLYDDQRRIARVLIAEDEVTIGDYYKMDLESRNHEVILTRDGEECISAFEKAYKGLKLNRVSNDEKNPFDLVVLDFRMPGKSGVEVAKHIISLCPKQKIIFATAYAFDVLDNLINKSKQGMEVIQKPFDLDAFAAMVEDVGQTAKAGTKKNRSLALSPSKKK